MAIKTVTKRHRRKIRLFIRQDGKCYYCNIRMVLIFSSKYFRLKNLATLEHLDNKESGMRGRFKNINVERTVLACKKCNCERGNVSPHQYRKNKGENYEVCTTNVSNFP